ncbi:hypothetical protein [Methanobrevibacter sp.]|uniref:hypothetical protein n=1 Tax=Methanobrevibacter sp. TaxID=66852 RepID=UPI00388EE391
MNIKRVLLVLSIFIVLLFAMGAYSANDHSSYDEIVELLQNANASDLTGCCSVVCQLEGNDSLMTFRRDAGYSADIFIEEIDWHGKQAIKQYKEEGGYFCQVIVTSDGWTIGYGGLDDGKDNEVIENITADMVVNNNISQSGLEEIQKIKTAYGRGHVVIKSPEGQYGVVINDTHFTGKLKPGDYLSVPNKYSYFRSGDIQLNASDKVKIMNKLEISDGYGLERRDITTYYFHHVDNDTFKGNVTDMFISNDDGSFYGMNTGGSYDNVHFNGSVIKGSTLPIAPTYRAFGTVEFPDEGNDILGFILTVLGYIATIILILIILVLGIRTYNKIRYARRDNRNIQHQINAKNFASLWNSKNSRNTKDLWGTQKNKKNRR